jgi:hypothetical protein
MFISWFGEMPAIYGRSISREKVWIKVCNAHSSEKKTGPVTPQVLGKN